MTGSGQARPNPFQHDAGNSGSANLSRDGQNETHLSRLAAQRQKRQDPLAVKVKLASQMRKPPQTEVIQC